MSWFGSPSRKPMMLYTNAVWFHELLQHRCSDDVLHLERLSTLRPDINGVPRPTGNAAVSASQAYPGPFGDAVAALFAEHRRCWGRRSHHGIHCRCRCQGATSPEAKCPAAIELLTAPCADDLWADAQLGRALHIAQARAHASGADVVVEMLG